MDVASEWLMVRFALASGRILKQSQNRKVEQSKALMRGSSIDGYRFGRKVRLALQDILFEVRR